MGELREKILEKLDERLEKKELVKYRINDQTFWTLPVERWNAWKQELIDIINKY